MVASIMSSLRTTPSLFLLLLLWLCADRVVGEETAFYKSVGLQKPLTATFGPFSNYHSQRPDIYPPVFKVEKSDPNKLSPGYIFITPYELSNPGPYIFDNTGVGPELRGWDADHGEADSGDIGVGMERLGYFRAR